MTIRNSLTGPLGTVALWLAFSGMAAGQPATPAKRFEMFKAMGTNAELTVFPVRLGGRSMPEVAEVIAVSLEHAGMQKLDWTTQVFPRPAQATFDQVTTAFGDFVRGNTAATEYSLYAEFLGTPGAGVTEIRGVLVDRAGDPVWSYRQTPQDAEFQKMQPKEPMQCMVMLVNGLREPLGLPDPFRPDGFEGRLTRRMAERTGLPTSSERAAMQKAIETARANAASSDLLVFPILAAGRPDPKQAAHLAEMLRSVPFGKADVATAQPAIEIPPVPNEQQRLWRMARGFRDYLRQSPAAAGYALFAEYTFAPDGRPFTVHLVLCDRSGEWVLVDFQNDHSPDFQSLDLKAGDDCDRLVAKRLARLLRQPSSDGK